MDIYISNLKRQNEKQNANTKQHKKHDRYLTPICSETKLAKTIEKGFGGG